MWNVGRRFEKWLMFTNMKSKRHVTHIWKTQNGKDTCDKTTIEFHLSLSRREGPDVQDEKIVLLPWGGKMVEKKHISNICQFQALRINNNGRTLIDLGAPALYYKGGNMEVTKSYPMERKIAVKLSCYN